MDLRPIQSACCGLRLSGCPRHSHPGMAADPSPETEGVTAVIPAAAFRLVRCGAAYRNRTDDLFITSDRRYVGWCRLTWANWPLTCGYSDPLSADVAPESDADGSPFGSPGQRSSTGSMTLNVEAGREPVLPGTPAFAGRALLSCEALTR